MLNGCESAFLDEAVLVLTNSRTWILLYLSFIYVILRNSTHYLQFFLVALCATMCVFFAGTINDIIVKPVVARWRPSRDSEIYALVDIVNNYKGGNYGFFSSHASNTFSIALFFSLLFKKRIITILLITWSLINCWTRIHLGVHFLGDILVGIVWGAFVGWGVYRLYSRSNHSFNIVNYKGMMVIATVFPLLVSYAFIKAFIVVYISC